MPAQISSRVRISAIPAILAAGTFATLPGLLKSAAAHQEASPAAEVAAWTELGLPELELHFTSAEITGMPESVEAGRYLVTIHGEPTEEEWAFGPAFFQLPEGMTMDDLAAVDTSQGPPAFFYEALFAGGPVILAATGETSAVGIVDLPSGDWLLAGAALAQPPAPFTVTGEMPADLPEPESDVTLTIGEMVINISEGAFQVGENLVKVDNIGAQPHFVEISKVPDGTTAENVEAMIAGFMGATPEAEPLAEEDAVSVAYSNEQSGGTVQWTTMTLSEPGTYVASCWIPDPETMMPHAMLGMHNVFVVEYPGDKHTIAGRGIPLPAHTHHLPSTEARPASHRAGSGVSGPPWLLSWNDRRQPPAGIGRSAAATRGTGVHARYHEDRPAGIAAPGRIDPAARSRPRDPGVARSHH